MWYFLCENQASYQGHSSAQVWAAAAQPENVNVSHGILNIKLQVKNYSSGSHSNNKQNIFLWTPEEKKPFHNGKVKNSFGKGVCSNQQHIPLLETGPLQPVHSTDYQLHINDPLLSRAEQDNKPRAEEGAIILRDMNKTTCHFNRRMKCYQGNQDRDATTI